MVEALLGKAGLTPRELWRIGVATGPGSFAGTRAGTAFARGLALASGAQAMGISSLSAMAFEADPDSTHTVFTAHASARTLATAEKIIDGNLLDDNRLAPACLPRHYVTALAPAPRGAWPYECPGPDGLLYGADADHLRAYATRTRDPAEMRAYLIEQGLMPAEAAE